MKALEQSEQNHQPRRGARPTSIHFVLNWTHITVFVAVAAIALVTLNQGFAGVNRRIDDLNLRMDERFEDVNQRMDERFENVNLRFDSVERGLDRVETRLDGVEDELSYMNARLTVVEHIVGVRDTAEVESPPDTAAADSDL